MQTNYNQQPKRYRLILGVIFIFLHLSIPHQVFAKGPAVNTWYKVTAKGYSKTVKAKKIAVTIPTKKSKEKKTTLKIDNRTISLRSVGKVTIKAQGSNKQPTPTAQSTGAVTVTSNPDSTVIKETTVSNKGIVKSKSTKIKHKSGSSTTTTVTTNPNGNREVETRVNET